MTNCVNLISGVLEAGALKNAAMEACVFSGGRGNGRPGFWPTSWNFTKILYLKDEMDFIHMAARILFYTLPIFGNEYGQLFRVDSKQEFVICTTSEVGQYTLDLFMDDALVQAMSYTNFCKGIPDEVGKQSFEIMKYLNNNDYSGITYDFVEEVIGIDDPDRALENCVKLGFLDVVKRNNKIKWDLTDMGSRFLEIFDFENNDHIVTFTPNGGYITSPRYQFCLAIAKQALDDITEGRIAVRIDRIDRTTPVEKQKKKTAKIRNNEPQNIYESYSPADDINWDDVEEESAEGGYYPPKTQSAEITEMKVYPKALTEEEVKEEMYRPMPQEEEEEVRTYTSNLGTSPAIDPLALARNKEVDEERVLALTQHITEFLVKEKTNIPQSAKTALKEALISLMEL